MVAQIYLMGREELDIIVLRLRMDSLGSIVNCLKMKQNSNKRKFRVQNQFKDKRVIVILNKSHVRKG